MHEPSASHLRAIVEGVVDGIIITDAEGRIDFANPAAESLFGYEPSELVGVEISALIPDDLGIEPELARDVGLPRNLILAFEGLTLDAKARSKTGGEFPVELTVTHIHAEADGRTPATSYTVIARDVSKRVSVHLDREKLEAVVAQSHKLESVGRLASGVAHEINTPTQYIADNLGFLQDSFGDILSVIEVSAEDESLRYLAEEIPLAIAEALEGTSQIASIVAAMKSFCHPGNEHRVPVDLNTSIQNTVNVCRNEWKSVADIEFDLSEVPLVPCFENEIKQVFLNIIVNAAHAIGGDPDRAAGSIGTIHITTRVEGDYLETVIADDGPGIPEDIRSKIFDPFFTTKEVGKGTGQGLALAQLTVVDKHAGEILIESAPGAGTSFRIRLPLAGAPL